MAADSRPHSRSVPGRVRRRRESAALRTQPPRMDQRGLEVVSPGLRRSGVLLARPPHDQESPASRQRPERRVVHPAGRRARRLLRARPRPENVSGRAPSRDGPVLPAPQQARACGGEGVQRLRAAGGARLRRSAAALRRTSGGGHGGRSLAHRRSSGAHRALRRNLDRRTSLSRTRTGRRRILSAARPARAHRPRTGHLRKRRNAHRARARRDLRLGDRLRRVRTIRAAPRARERGLAEGLRRSEARRPLRSASVFRVPRSHGRRHLPRTRAQARERSARPSKEESRRARSGSRFRTDRWA